MIRLALCLALLLACPLAFGAERRPIAGIDISALTKDTQATPVGARDNHISVVWWIPTEFWQAVMARDTSTTQQGKDALIKAMGGVSLLAVVQADVSPMGAFNYYGEDLVKKGMRVTVADATGKRQPLALLQKVNPDLEVALGVFKPILSAAMGNLGQNFHFFVLDDRAPKGRVLDPYQKAKLSVELRRADNAPMTATIELPLNSLFIPRLCPNGQEAHISWNFCPWNGERLPD